MNQYLIWRQFLGNCWLKTMWTNFQLWQWENKRQRLKRIAFCATNVVIHHSIKVKWRSILWENTTETQKKNQTSAVTVTMLLILNKIWWDTWKLSMTKMCQELEQRKTSGQGQWANVSSLAIPLFWEQITWCIWENIMVKSPLSVKNALMKRVNRPS